MAEAPIELLERIPLFQGLSHGELERIARSFKERRVRSGDTVAVEGAGGVGFFVIGEGAARVDVHGEDRGRLGPGDYFGEMALIDDQARRTATVTADSDLTCYGLTSWEFRPLVETNAQIAWKLLQVMAKRLRDLEQQQVST
ncbi:MAG: cyclic nucleotide-binding domain-containing protein [Actinobacteria bacterium]|nr:MAG: cyclic nucleotide-binding domain-containing protein [Actinomycetota bacterium]TMM23188.1 MAG: cyclic nucleotide-binding domain-containing protein [Actinomycetota bacterium]